MKVAAANSVATPGPSPSPGSGILTRFPFDGRPAASLGVCAAVRHAARICVNASERAHAQQQLVLTDPAPFGKTFARVLGPTDPCSTAVGTEPFSTSVFEGLVRIFATTTEICTRGRLHPGSRPRLPCAPRRPPTRRGIGSARLYSLLAATVRHRSVAPAPSIFGAGRFGR